MIELTLIGGPTALFRYAGLSWLTDPTFSPPGEYAGGLVKTTGPALAAAEIGAIDAVLLSHDQHADNLDPAGRELLRRARRVLSTPAAAQRLGGAVVGLEPWSELLLPAPGGVEVSVTAVPAQHGPEGCEPVIGPVCGFVLAAPGQETLYVSGDNASLEVVDAVVSRCGPVDVALLFAGAVQIPHRFDGAYLTLSADLAALAARRLGARLAVAVHFEGWTHFTQGARELRAAFAGQGLAERLVVPERGRPVRLSVRPDAGGRGRSAARPGRSDREREGKGSDLELALALADLADAITMARFRAADLIVETKPDLTPVSEADRAAERKLRERLAAARPGDAVIGEEFGEQARSWPDPGRRWIIDPIDGTKSYVRGLPTWSTLIALQDGGETVLGVVSMPAVGRRWWACRGAGAFCSEVAAVRAGADVGWDRSLGVLSDCAEAHRMSRARRLAVSRVAALGDAQMAWSGVEDWEAVGRLEQIISLAKACWRSRGIGDAWQYMLVAEGAAEIALDPQVKLWDLAAPQIIVEEAGGRFTDLRGVARADGGSGVATNGLVHDQVLALLAAVAQ